MGRKPWNGTFLWYIVPLLYSIPLPFVVRHIQCILTYSSAFSSGYNRAESLADYKSGEEFVFMLVDLVSRGGNLLLNVGPSGAGFRQKPQTRNDDALTHCARRRWHNSGDNAAALG
jgi:hypothetical protein